MHWPGLTTTAHAWAPMDWPSQAWSPLTWPGLSLLWDSSLIRVCKGYIREHHDRQRNVKQIWHCSRINYLKVVYVTVEIPNIYCCWEILFDRRPRIPVVQNRWWAGDAVLCKVGIESGGGFPKMHSALPQNAQCPSTNCTAVFPSIAVKPIKLIILVGQIKHPKQ